MKKYIVAFHEYYFDWLIEIKDNKLKITIDKIEIEEDDKKYSVTSSNTSPVKFMMSNKEKVNLWWQLSKAYFITNMNKLVESLQMEIVKREF